jgi:formyl-CoA transferase
MAGALDGVKVLEIAQVMAIPVCGVLLSDMGANVVKVEPPSGDASRHTMLPVLPGESKSFAVLNRGKRSAVLDLADERSRPALEALVRWADVVLVSLKHEDLATYRIGYEHLRPLNEEMVYLEHTPLGHNGPKGDTGSYDLNVMGISGITALIGKETRGTPQYTQPAITDMGTGYLSAMAVCAALYARKTSGCGQRIETSILATGMISMCNSAHEFAAFGHEDREEFLSGLAEMRSRGAAYSEMQRLRDATVQRARRGNIYYRYYKTRDSFISVGCLSPRLQAKFREATGITDPRREKDSDPGSDEGRKALAQLTIDTEALMASRTNADWSELFARYKIPCGPVSFPEEVPNDPQLVENGYVIELDHPILGPYKTFAPPVRMDGTPTEAQGPSPLLGEHTEEVLREAGLADMEIGTSATNRPEQ